MSRRNDQLRRLSSRDQCKLDRDRQTKCVGLARALRAVFGHALSLLLWRDYLIIVPSADNSSLALHAGFSLSLQITSLHVTSISANQRHERWAKRRTHPEKSIGTIAFCICYVPISQIELKFSGLSYQATEIQFIRGIVRTLHYHRKFSSIQSIKLNCNWFSIINAINQRWANLTRTSMSLNRFKFEMSNRLTNLIESLF